MCMCPAFAKGIWVLKTIYFKMKGKKTQKKKKKRGHD